MGLHFLWIDSDPFAYLNLVPHKLSLVAGEMTLLDLDVDVVYAVPLENLMYCIHVIIKTGTPYHTVIAVQHAPFPYKPP